MNSRHPPLILEEKSDVTSSDQDGASVGQPVQLMQGGRYVKCKALCAVCAVQLILTGLLASSIFAGLSYSL